MVTAAWGARGMQALRRCAAPGALEPHRAVLRASPWLASVRWASSGRQQGTVKLWNEERGFGFITPADGGEDVFMHRSSLAEGVQVTQGASVSFEAVWDDKKKKNRASDVTPAEAGNDGSSAQEAPAQRKAAPAAAAASAGPARAHHIVGAFGGWAINREPMTADGANGALRHRITIRNDAPKGDGDKRREEFQIVGDASWDKRVYPAGHDKEEVVVLRPGTGSRAASERGKGHGRNWAVEGRPGAAFDIHYDPASQTVTCEESR